MIAEGLIFIRPRGEELDQSSPTPNDRPTFYVEPIHPKRHHLVECLGNHLGGDRKADRALVERVLVSFTKSPVISVGSDLKRPYRRYAGGSRNRRSLSRMTVMMISNIPTPSSRKEDRRYDEKASSDSTLVPK